MFCFLGGLIISMNTLICYYGKMNTLICLLWKETFQTRIVIELLHFPNILFSFYFFVMISAHVALDVDTIYPCEKNKNTNHIFRLFYQYWDYIYCLFESTCMLKLTSPFFVCYAEAKHYHISVKCDKWIISRCYDWWLSEVIEGHVTLVTMLTIAVWGCIGLCG